MFTKTQVTTLKIYIEFQYSHQLNSSCPTPLTLACPGGMWTQNSAFLQDRWWWGSGHRSLHSLQLPATNFDSETRLTFQGQLSSPDLTLNCQRVSPPARDVVHQHHPLVAQSPHNHIFLSIHAQLWPQKAHSCPYFHSAD